MKYATLSRLCLILAATTPFLARADDGLSEFRKDVARSCPNKFLYQAKKFGEEVFWGGVAPLGHAVGGILGVFYDAGHALGSLILAWDPKDAVNVIREMPMTSTFFGEAISIDVQISREMREKRLAGAPLACQSALFRLRAAEKEVALRKANASRAAYSRDITVSSKIGNKSVSGAPTRSTAAKRATLSANSG